MGALSPARIVADCTAVVVIDVQNDFCHPDGLRGRNGGDVSGMVEVVARINDLVAATRRFDVPAIFVYTTHGPESDSPMWLGRNVDVARPQSCQKGSWGAGFFGIEPEAGDHVVEKHRYSAFWATPLQQVLQDLGRQSVVLCGVATNVCVETTLRDAVDRDFYATIVSDACGAHRKEAHDNTLKSVERSFGLVCDTGSIIDYWSRGGDR